VTLDVTLGNNAIPAAAIASNAITAAKLAADAAEKIADVTLRRTTANVEGSSNGDTLSHRSLYGAISRAAHKRVRAGGNITTYKSDDTTELVQDAISTTSGVDPITTVDPPA
jgi:hypothetical protein